MKNTFKILVIILLVLAISLIYFSVFPSKIITTSIITDVESPTLIIDAGHGGQDSGTIAKDGTFESDINLAISYKLKDFLVSFGFNVIMTRTDENLIGDNTLPTIRERKRSDVKKRLEIIESAQNPVLISIHQNYFTSSEYYGVQVFYSKNHSESEILAGYIQNSAVSHIQKENKRQIKPSGKEIWLLHNTQCPAIMIECGFLSNSEELEKLKDDTYQKDIAFMITMGIINYYTKI